MSYCELGVWVGGWVDGWVGGRRTYIEFFLVDALDIADVTDPVLEEAVVFVGHRGLHTAAC